MTVDTRYTPLASILQHVEGAAWAVNYYAQILDKDSELGPQQLDRSAVYQQYCLIKGLELRVTTGLTESQDEESKSMIVSGEATLYPGMIPNKGDMFLADAGDGREAVFTVITAEKKTHLKDSLYVITYELRQFNDMLTRDDLVRKTIKTTVFVKDFAYFGQNPQVLEEDYSKLIDFKQSYRELLGFYFGDFFSRENETFMIPGQTEPSYDPWLTKAILDWIGTDEHPMVKQVRLPAVDGDTTMIQTTVWDCISRMSIDMLPMALQEVKLIPIAHFRSCPQYASVYFTQIKQVLYPLDDRTDVDAPYDEVNPIPVGAEVKMGGRRYKDLRRLVASTPLNGFDYTVPAPPTLPDIVRVTDDSFYVFSEAFYRQQTPLKSNLERLVMSTLRQESLDLPTLSNLARNAMKWENLERFYYIPVVLALLKVALRTN